VISLDRVYRHAPGIETATLAGEKVILDPHGRKLRGLNSTGAQVWELLDGKRTVREVARALANSAGVDEARALTDVQAFLTELESRQLIA
jgi:pyrroloquinoline quinone biosynthesis protein D